MIKRLVCKIWRCKQWGWKDINDKWKAKQYIPRCPRCGTKIND